jgi:hypothetical protein
LVNFLNGGLHQALNVLVGFVDLQGVDVKEGGGKIMVLGQTMGVP